jgi:hypothetical protein
LIAMLALGRPDGPSPNGPVGGRVSYNGRPLDRGAIVFAPVEGDAVEWAIAPIGTDGRYTIRPNWCRGHAGKTRFRMCIVSFPHTFTAEEVMPPPVRGPGRDSDAAQNADVPREMAVGLPIPERFTAIWTSGLEVTLDQDSASVDLDLKD